MEDEKNAPGDRPLSNVGFNVSDCPIARAGDREDTHSRRSGCIGGPADWYNDPREPNRWRRTDHGQKKSKINQIRKKFQNPARVSRRRGGGKWRNVLVEISSNSFTFPHGILRYRLGVLAFLGVVSYHVVSPSAPRLSVAAPAASFFQPQHHGRRVRPHAMTSQDTATVLWYALLVYSTSRAQPRAP